MQSDDFVRTSVRASLRRLSIDTGSALGAVHPEEVENLLNARGSVDVESGNDVENDSNHLNIDFHTVHPRTLLSHTVRSNIDGFVTAAPTLAMIFALNRFMNYLHSRGGAFIDMHAVRCSVCMIGMELCCLFAVHGFSPSRSHMIRKLGIQWPLPLRLLYAHQLASFRLATRIASDTLALGMLCARNVRILSNAAERDTSVHHKRFDRERCDRLRGAHLHRYIYICTGYPDEDDRKER